MAYKPYRTKKKLDGFRSLLEKNFAAYLKKIGIDFLYEAIKIPYIVPAKKRNYVPDFVYNPKSRRRVKKVISLDDLKNMIVIETKGRLTASDRKKMLWVKENNPEIDIRFVFPNNSILSKAKKGRDGGKYRYSDWCEDNGFPYFIGTEPPKKWFK